MSKESEKRKKKKTDTISRSLNDKGAAPLLLEISAYV